MADEGKPRRRRKWLVPLLAVGAGAWFVRSRRGPAPDAWLPPLPAAAVEPVAPANAASADATPDPAPSAEPTEPASTVNGSAPVAPPEAPPNALFTDEPEKGVAPLADGSAPGPEFVIKGNAGSMLFHTQSSPYYGRTKAEVWFRTEEEATAAGFTKWTRRRANG
jgi:hypothetical protein